MRLDQITFCVIFFFAHDAIDLFEYPVATLSQALIKNKRHSHTITHSSESFSLICISIQASNSSSSSAINEYLMKSTAFIRNEIHFENLYGMRFMAQLASGLFSMSVQFSFMNSDLSVGTLRDDSKLSSIFDL